MSFTVRGEHPDGGGHSEFDRATALGAVFKATEALPVSLHDDSIPSPRSEVRSGFSVVWKRAGRSISS
jgi:hypothetical protein